MLFLFQDIQLFPPKSKSRTFFIRKLFLAEKVKTFKAETIYSSPKSIALSVQSQVVKTIPEILKTKFKSIKKVYQKQNLKENRDSHIAFSPISQSSFFERLRCLILASSQKKLYGYIEILKSYITIKKKKI